MKKLFFLTAAVLTSFSLMAEVVTWTPTEADVTTLLTKTAPTAITVGTGNMSFQVYSIRPFYDQNDVKIAWDATNVAIKTTDNGLNKAGLAVYIPAGSAEVEGITIYMHQSNSRKTYYAAPADTKPATSGTATDVIAKTSTGYDFWTTFEEDKYYGFGGKTGGSGDLWYDSIKVSFKAADHTKATVKSISIDGVALETFAAGQFSYNVELPYGYSGLPTVAASTANDATVNITQVTSLPGSATVVCTSQDGTSDTKTYTINFTVKATASADATLSDIKVNGNSISGFDAATEIYNYGEIGVYEAFVVTCTTTDPNATPVVTPDEANHEVSILVTAENGTDNKTYTVSYTRKAATELTTIGSSTVWDFSKAGQKTAELTDTSLPTKNAEFNYADVLNGADASFNAAALVGRAQYANNGDNTQAYLVKFKTSVPGTIVVEFSNTGTSERPDRVLLVNDVQTEYKSKTSASHVTTSPIAVEAGEVAIEALEMKDPAVKNMIRIYKITFTKDGDTAIDNTEASEKIMKSFENGQLVIIKNGIKYNATGAIVK